MIVELTPAAEADLFDAAIAYEREREGLGSRFESQVDRVLTRISTRPLQFAQIADDGVRRALVRVFPYAVFFILVEDRARVFAILHQHRQPEAWLGRTQR
jgi:plasmid stabilization system protein ParE